MTTAKFSNNLLATLPLRPVKLRSLLITLILTSIVVLGLLEKVRAQKTDTEVQAGRTCNAIGRSVAFVLRRHNLPSSGIRARGHSTPDGLYLCIVSRQSTVLMKIGLDRHGRWSDPY